MFRPDSNPYANMVAAVNICTQRPDSKPSVAVAVDVQEYSGKGTHCEVACAIQIAVKGVLDRSPYC
jgi:hypothetical protein